MPTLSSDVSQRTQHTGAPPSESALTSVESDVEHSGLIPAPQSFLSTVRKWGRRSPQQLCESETLTALSHPESQQDALLCWYNIGCLRTAVVCSLSNYYKVGFHHKEMINGKITVFSLIPTLRQYIHVSTHHLIPINTHKEFPSMFITLSILSLITNSIENSPHSYHYYNSYQQH